MASAWLLVAVAACGIAFADEYSEPLARQVSYRQGGRVIIGSTHTELQAVRYASAAYERNVSSLFNWSCMSCAVADNLTVLEVFDVRLTWCYTVLDLITVPGSHR